MIEEYEMALIVVNEGYLDILTFISLKTKSEENMLPVRTKGTFLYHILSKSPQKKPPFSNHSNSGSQHSLPYSNSSLASFFSSPTMKNLLALAVGLPVFAAAQSPCDATCAGTTKDGVAFNLSALMGVDYNTTDASGLTYYLNVCGTAAQTCPNDAGDPPVTEGCAVQTQDNGCYVLGAYKGDNCLWTGNPQGQQGVQLVLDDGSNNLCGDGSPRQLTIDFLCPDEGNSGPLVPDSWDVQNPPQSCSYTCK